MLLVCYTPLASVRGPYYLGVGSISGSLSLSQWSPDAAGQWVRVLRQAYKSVEGLATISDSHTTPATTKLHAYNLSGETQS